jgi:hypothetical protein
MFYGQCNACGERWSLGTASTCKCQDATPKKEWVGLTDEEIKEIIGPWGDAPIKGYTRLLFDRIEQKLKEKNGG